MQNDAAEATGTVEATNLTAAVAEDEVRKIPRAIKKAKTALGELEKKLKQFEEQAKATESPVSYMRVPIERAHTAFDSLSAQVIVLEDAAAEIPTKALSNGFAAANVALEQVQALATDYDDQFQLSSKLSTAVNEPRQRATIALAEASDLAASVAAVANAKLQGVNQGIRERAGSIFSQAAVLNERFDVENKAATARAVVAEGANALDECFKVKENVNALAAKGLDKAQELDSRLTGGRASLAAQSAFEQGLKLATLGVAEMQAGYASAKQQRQAATS